MDIYIKPFKSVTLVNRREIRVRDVAEVVAAPEVKIKAEKARLRDTEGVKTAYLIPVTDIIEAVGRAAPGNTVSNVGENDTLVNYLPRQPKPNPLWQWLKIAFVSVTLAAGASTAIMSFHNDAQIPTIFRSYYKMFFGEDIERPLIIELPYSVGIAAGVIIFFNHFAGKKLTDDPTPIEVEMSKYDADVTNTMIGMLSASRGDKAKPGGGDQNGLNGGA